MLLLNAAALAIFAGTAVQAAMWNIEVGANGLIFNPPSIIAAPADIIVFTFISGAHTVTQSTFANPCTPIIGGVDSGPRPALPTRPSTFNYTVNGTGPVWFYCKTGHHCPNGMVFAINPTAKKTYEAFKANAQNSTISNDNDTTSSASSTASGSTASAATGPAATSKAAANERATVAIGAIAAALLFGGVSAL